MSTHTQVFGPGVQPAVSILLARKNGVFHAWAGEFEAVAKTPAEAIRLAATAALDVPPGRIEIISFSPTCVRASVKPAREPLDPVVVWLVVFFVAGALSLAALFWRNGGQP